jgi:hypothetical protein
LCIFILVLNLADLAPNTSLEAFLILPEVTNIGLFFAGAYGMYQGIEVSGILEGGTEG